MKKFNPEEALCKTRREFGEHGGVTPSISRSATFTVMEPDRMPEIFEGILSPEKGGCFLYSRHFNPTVDTLSRYLAAMEGSESAVCTGSGMAAISCSLLQLCKSGDHVISSNTVYGGTHALLSELFKEMNISTTFVDPIDINGFKTAITPKTKVIYVETIGNPTLKVADIRALSKLSKAHGLTLIVDNTFAPMIISPLKLGADIVVYSMTKFINGASDLLAGAICASKEFIHKLMDLHTGRLMLLGPTMDPRVAFDIIQRLPHLAIRMREHSSRAMAIANKLYDLGVDVCYPGLPANPQHDLMKSMLNESYGYSGLLTIDCKTKEKAENFMGMLQNKENFGYIAVSLGYFDTLMSCSGSSTSSEISLQEQSEIGISPGLLRIAIGFTGSIDERISQIVRAVKTVGLIS